MGYTRVMEKRAQIGLKLPPALIARIDEARLALDFPPDRTQIIERAITEWLAKFHTGRSDKRKDRG